MKQRSTYGLHTLQKLMRKMKQIVRTQHIDDFCSDWGRKEQTRDKVTGVMEKGKVIGVKV